VTTETRWSKLTEVEPAMRQRVRRSRLGLANARWPCHTLEHVGSGAADEWRAWDRRVARRISSVSFLLSRDSAFRREARTKLAMPSPTFDPTATGPTGLAIANHVGRLISEYTGRGPTKARTSFSADLVTVVVRDLLTKGERSLVRDGRADLVLDLRRAYQATMGDELTDGIEEITGRHVIAFLSANHVDPDIAIESFVLAPQDNGHHARHAPMD
jgi:uncharacterized protein YbcI